MNNKGASTLIRRLHSVLSPSTLHLVVDSRKTRGELKGSPPPHCLSKADRFWFFFFFQTNFVFIFNLQLPPVALKLCFFSTSARPGGPRSDCRPDSDFQPIPIEEEVEKRPRTKEEAPCRHALWRRCHGNLSGRASDVAQSEQSHIPFGHLLYKPVCGQSALKTRLVGIRVTCSRKAARRWFS